MKSAARVRAEEQVARLEAAGWQRNAAGRWWHPDRPRAVSRSTSDAVRFQEMVEAVARACDAPVELVQSPADDDEEWRP